jgi:alanine-synthesizing transaminase
MCSVTHGAAAKNPGYRPCYASKTQARQAQDFCDKGAGVTSPEWSFPRAESLPTYAFVACDRVKARVRAAGADVIDLGLGNPDHPTPKAIVDQLEVASRDGKNHRYHPGRGHPELRAAICEWYERRYHARFSPDRNVVVSLGAKDGMTGLCLAVLDRGDSVLSPDPCYPIHRGAPIIAGADVLTYPSTAPDPAKAISDAIAAAEKSGQRIKLVFANYPQNPTGRTLSREAMRDLVRVVGDSGAILVHDLAYADLDFSSRYAPSIFDCGIDPEKVLEFGVEIFSMSKSYHMPGWRIGYVVGGDRIIDALAHLKTYTDYGSFAPIQIASAWALRNGDSIAQEVHELYRNRALHLVKGLEQAGWDGVRAPEGTMFLWVPVPKKLSHLNSFDAVNQLIEKAHVACTPGAGFGVGGEGFVRFALVEDPPRIAEACARLKTFLSGGERSLSARP